MFAGLPTPLRISTFQHYAPHHPSPLSSSPLRNSPSSSPLADRNTNVPTRSAIEDCVMSSPTKRRGRANAISHLPVTSTPTPVEHELMSPPQSSPPPSASSPQRKTRGVGKEAFSKRSIKANPLTSVRGNGRETRRKLFLKKIKEDRDEERWQKRMENGGEEEVLRVLWVEEERARLERRRREADSVGFPGDEELEEESYDELMAADLARQEELELEGLIATYSQDQTNINSQDHDMEVIYQAPVQEQQHTETPYGSDDEEYDHIFMDVIEQENRVASQHQFQTQQLQQQPKEPLPVYLEDHEMMDMS